MPSRLRLYGALQKPSLWQFSLAFLWIFFAKPMVWFQSRQASRELHSHFMRGDNFHCKVSMPDTLHSQGHSWSSIDKNFRDWSFSRWGHDQEAMQVSQLMYRYASILFAFVVSIITMLISFISATVRTELREVILINPNYQNNILILCLLWHIYICSGKVHVFMFRR